MNRFQVKDAGRYKEFERTQGVSTTDLIQRMLSMSPSTTDGGSGGGKDSSNDSPWTGKEPLFLTTRKIMQFAEDFVDKPVSILS